MNCNTTKQYLCRERAMCSQSLLGVTVAAAMLCSSAAVADGVSTPEEVQRDCMLALTPDESVEVSVDDKARCIQAIEKAMTKNKRGKNAGASTSAGAQSATAKATSGSIPFISSLNLRPKVTEIGFGFSYSQNLARSGLRTDRSRDLSIPLSVTLGLTPKIETSFSVSMQNNTNEVAGAGQVNEYKVSGTGDSTVGLSYRLDPGRFGFASTNITATYGIPTGKPSDPRVTGSTGTGSGYKYGSLAVTLIKDSDPAVLFSNFAYRYVFERDDGDFTVQPGATMSYGFGAGFAINNKLTLSGSFSGSIQGETIYNGEVFAGSGREPISFRSGLTYTTSTSKRFEGNLGYGLNDDASAVSFDFMYLFSF